MNRKSVSASLLSLIFGIVYALLLQHTDRGRALATRMTWVSVVIGVGGNLLISLIVVPIQAWQRVAGVFALSSLGIIARSLINEIGDIVETNRRNAAQYGA